MKNWKCNFVLPVFLLLQAALFALILSGNWMWQIAFLRYLIAFINLAIVPGYLILNAIDIKKLDAARILFFSVGLSLSFLICLGLLINFLLPLLGISSPLSFWPLYLSYLTALCGLGIVYFLKNYRVPTEEKLDTEYLLKGIPILHYLLLVILPICSIIGVIFLDNYGNNLFLMVLIIIIALYAIVLFVSGRDRVNHDHCFNSFALFCFSLSLLLHYWMPTRYIVGFDVHPEYYFANLVNLNGYWTASIYGNANSVLSTAILPVYFVRFMNIDLTLVFKLLIPLFFALVPAIIYNIFVFEFDGRIAFLASFFFLSFYKYFTLSSNKEQIGELFLALFLVTLFDKKIPAFKRNMLAIIFIISLIFSHYGLSFIMIGMLLFTWLYSRILGRIGKDEQDCKPLLSSTLLTIFIVLTITWYSYVSASSGFAAIVTIGNQIFSTVTKDFMATSAMDPIVIKALGGQVGSIWHQINRAIFYVTFIFIIIGVGRIVIFNRIFKKRIKERPGLIPENEGLVIINLIILCLCVIIPYFASYLDMDRFFQIALLFLSPFCIIGGLEIGALILSMVKITKWKQYIAEYMVCIVILLFYLFNTGVIYELVGDTPQLMLGKYRMEQSTDQNVEYVLHSALINDEEYDGVDWLKAYRNEKCQVYANYVDTTQILASYGMLGPQTAQSLSLDQAISNNSYVYLGSFTVKDGYLSEQSTERIRETVIYPADENKNIWQMNNVFSDGGSEILTK